MAQSSDDITSQRIFSIGGLNNNESSLILSEQSPGCASSLVNYEVGKSGGYRRINGYAKFSATDGAVGHHVSLGEQAKGPVLGVFFFFNTFLKSTYVLAMRKLNNGSGNYGIFKLVTGTGWVLETTPSPRAMITTVGSVNKVTGEQFNFGSGNYLAIADGVNYALIYDGTTWYDIKASNAGSSLGAAGGNQAIDHPDYVAIFKNTLFLGGDTTSNGEGRFVYSAPNLPYNFTVASGGGQAFPGFNPIALKPFRDDLYVFGLPKISKAVPSTTAGFLLQAVTDDIGCISADSILEVGANLIFLSPDGIRPVAGTNKINDVELGLLSRDIQPIIDKLTVADTEGLVGVVVRKKTQFRYFLGQGNDPADVSRGIIGGTRINQREGIKSWEFGELVGIRASCAWSGLIDGRERVLHGDYDGWVYEQEIGSSFDGNAITSTYSSPYLDFGSTDVRKLMRKVSIHLEAEGAMNSTLGIDFDWGDGRTLTPSNYQTQVQTGNSLYDTALVIYDDPSHSIKYGGPRRPVLKVNLQGSCFSVKFTYFNTGNDLPFTIHGFVPEFSIKGRN